MKRSLRDDIADSGGWMVWLADGFGLIALWLTLYACVLIMEALSAPVPQ